jgi:hypothetical protein
MNQHEPRSSLGQLSTAQEQRFRSAGVAVRERGGRSAPVTTVAAVGHARRRRAGSAIAAVVAVVVVSLAVLSLAGRGGTSTVRTGANGGTAPSTTAPTPTAPAINWNTSTVSLQADQVGIVAAGQDFAPPTSAHQIDVHSDPGDLPPAGYTTLELTWEQHGVEMRINIYFESDAHRWWANEIRIYNGKATGADWVTFDGRWFDAPLGQPYTGDLHLAKDGASLDIGGLLLKAFVEPSACQQHQTPDALQALYPTIEMGLPPSGYGAAVRLFDGSCTPITDLSGVAIAWTAEDPSIVAVATDAGMPVTTAGLTGRRAGSTVVHVVARDKATGALLATTSMQVTITR